MVSAYTFPCTLNTCLDFMPHSLSQYDTTQRVITRCWI